MINQIQLAEQFDKIFTDEEVYEFYEEWRNKKGNKKSSILSKVNDALKISVILIAAFLFWTIYDCFRAKVEQDVYHGHFVTWVWKGGNIIKSWHSDIDLVTDSLKTAQYNEGKKLLKLLK